MELGLGCRGRWFAIACLGAAASLNPIAQRVRDVGTLVLAARLKKEISIFHRVREFLRPDARHVDAQPVQPGDRVKYSVFASASPQARFVGFSGGRIVPRCFPSGVNTQTPPGPAA